MADEITSVLGLRIRALGSPLPKRAALNNWGNVLNDELRLIDRAIGESCDPDQVDKIRAIIHAGTEEGLLL